MGYSIKPIAAVAEYFARHHPALADRTPVVYEEFVPGVGWKRSAWNKRISRNYARALRRMGVTSVGLTPDPDPRYGARIVADFRIEELVR